MTDHRDETPPDTGSPPWGSGGEDPGTGPRGPGTLPAGPARPETPARPGAQVTENSVEPVEDMEAKIAEMEDRWLRSAAELDNFRKRIARDAERIRLDERGRVAREWLPVVDNLDLALWHADTDDDPVIEGVRAVRDQAVALLTRLGYPRHEQVGVPFDPAIYDAVGTLEDPDLAAGTVVEVVRPGYGEGPRQLRPAAVIVSTTPE